MQEKLTKDQLSQTLIHRPYQGQSGDLLQAKETPGKILLLLPSSADHLFQARRDCS
jgi:hypothetical protein